MVMFNGYVHNLCMFSFLGFFFFVRINILQSDVTVKTPRDTLHVQVILPITVYDALGKSTVNKVKVNEVSSNYY